MEAAALMAKQAGGVEGNTEQNVPLYRVWIGDKWERLVRTFGRRPTVVLLALATVFVLVFILILVLGVIGLVTGLRWYLSPNNTLPIADRKALVQGIASVAQALAVGLAGAVGLVGLFFTWRSLRQARESQDKTQESTQRTLELTEQGQITERFTRAIEQLGDKNLDVRVGGIYSLERIAIHSEGDYSTIMGILNTYIREHARWEPEQDSDEEKDPQLPQDIQAALTVLGRRTRYRGKGDDRVLNLQRVDLRGADLREAHLEGAKLAGSHLEKADLRSSHLKSADLRAVQLIMANLVSADIEKADLWRANLRHAGLLSANLEGVNLNSAMLDGAYLQGADLKETNLAHTTLDGAFLNELRVPNNLDLPERVTNLQEANWLSQEQIERANGDDTTLLPAGLIRPSWWSKVPLVGNRQLSPGRYSINVLKVALSFEVGEGWRTHVARWSETLELGHRYWNLAFLKIRDIYDPSKPSTEPPLPMPEDPITWLQELEQPYLVLGEPLPETIGGVSGKRIDIEVADVPKDQPWEFPRPGVLFCRVNRDRNVRASRYMFVQGNKCRLIFLNVEGEPVTIFLASREDRFDEAIQAVQKLLNTVKWTNLETLHLRDDLPETWLSKSNALIERGQYKEALEASEKALSLEHDLPGAWHDKGNALMNLGRSKEALEASERALSLRHDFLQALYLKLWALRDLGRNEEALEASERVLSLKPDLRQQSDAGYLKDEALANLE